MSSLPTSVTDGDLGHLGHHEELHTLIGNAAFDSRSVISVAASDTVTLFARGANFTCDGVRDQDTVNDAVDALPAEGGIVLLLPGTFVIDGDNPRSIEITRDDVSLVGEPGAVLDVRTTGAIAPAGTSATPISNIRIEGVTLKDFDPASHNTDDPDWAFGDETHGILPQYVDNLEISRCTFVDIGDEAVEVRGVHGCWVHHCWSQGTPSIDGVGAPLAIMADDNRETVGVWFERNYLEGGAVGSHVQIRDGAGRQAIRHVRIEDNVSVDAAEFGIFLRANDVASHEDWRVAGNTLRNCPKRAIFEIGGASKSHVVVEGNTILDGGQDAASADAAIRLLACPDAEVRNNRIDGFGAASANAPRAIATIETAVVAGNHVKNPKGIGIAVEGAKSDVSDNDVEGATRGVHVAGSGAGSRIHGNRVLSCTTGMWANAGKVDAWDNAIDDCTDDGMEWRGSDSVLRGNRVAGCDVGINVISGNDAEVLDNDVRGNTTAAISAPSTSLIRRNLGHATEAKGSDLIDNASTSVTIAHGLVDTPEGVVVSPENDERLWVSARTASDFTVTRDNSSGTNRFAWKAWVA